MNKTARNYGLDALKFAAICIIVLHHYQQISGAHYDFINFYQGRFYWGYLVELFFILSGYFTAKYVARIDGDSSVASLFFGKLVRFLPLLIVCGSVTIAAELLFSASGGNSTMELTLWCVVSSLTGIARWLSTSMMINNPTWYISVLLLCYVVFFVATKLAKRWGANPYGVFCAIVGIGLIMRWVCLAYGIAFPFFNLFIARGLVCFFAGLVLYRLLQGSKGNSDALVLVSLLVLVLFLLAFSFWPDMVTGYDGYQPALTLADNTLWMTLCFVVYPAVIVVFRSKYLGRLFAHPVFRRMGDISYNMYMWHIPVILPLLSIAMVFGLNVQSRAAMLLALLAVFAVGAISARYVDGPLSSRVRLLVKESARTDRP